MPNGDSPPKSYPSYFLVSVSTRKNLDLCIKHALAGFPGGESGAWTFCEIADGDFVSFLYGARAHNLYQVSRREALRDPEHLPPSWEPLTFGKDKKVYFPFRLHLRPVRVFDEPLVRPEFSYVAENLLRRGGYSKTHFQADQTTLQSVSGMGTVAEKALSILELPEHSAFTVRFSRTKSLAHPPEVLRFTEMILQSAIRRHLTSQDNLQTLLTQIGLSEVHAGALEILGEKALAEGHIDLLLKERIPLGSALKIPIEVKTKGATAKDVGQLRGYMAELQGECPVAMLVAEDFGKKAIAEASDNRIKLVRYELKTDLKSKLSFEEIYKSLSLNAIAK
jgi:hypothetical protein